MSKNSAQRGLVARTVDEQADAGPEMLDRRHAMSQRIARVDRRGQMPGKGQADGTGCISSDKEGRARQIDDLDKVGPLRLLPTDFGSDGRRIGERGAGDDRAGMASRAGLSAGSPSVPFERAASSGGAPAI